MERHFDEELSGLKSQLLKMSALVEEAISRSVKALVERKAELVEEVIKSDEVINMLEIEIDELCLKLLALYQPAAVDLRFVCSAMKINNELERIGDQAVNIAERAREVIKEPLLKPLIDIPRMGLLAQKMVKDAIDALVNKDDALAGDVCRRDDEVDSLNNQIFRELLTYMIEDPKTITRAVELILVGRHLERIADHATNISEDVIYFLKGKNIKHHLEDQ
ncbi:MAG: phosphate signaling complex protein PhoU [Candidatus Omnitrophica bacterium]|nr:phosphate signaling complex protein PhoU [Candidatus Omnitrophota bacterium]